MVAHLLVRTHVIYVRVSDLLIFCKKELFVSIDLYIVSTVFSGFLGVAWNLTPQPPLRQAERGSIFLSFRGGSVRGEVKKIMYFLI
ncbi:hypothetical protein NIES4073_52990 [Kalymmatonema gypsitolerans NIES-4073]|nr:hypothetical protein NIES4073_52990 [Scytonema sp. NIES-4073]